MIHCHPARFGGVHSARMLTLVRLLGSLSTAGLSGCVSLLEAQLRKIPFCTAHPTAMRQIVNDFGSQEGDHLICITVDHHGGAVRIRDRWTESSWLYCNERTYLIRPDRLYAGPVERVYSVQSDDAVAVFDNLYDLTARGYSWQTRWPFQSVPAEYSSVTMGRKPGALVHVGSYSYAIVKSAIYWQDYLLDDVKPPDADLAEYCLFHEAFASESALILQAIDAFDQVCRVASMAQEAAAQDKPARPSD